MFCSAGNHDQNDGDNDNNLMYYMTAILLLQTCHSIYALILQVSIKQNMSTIPLLECCVIFNLMWYMF